ncbi:MULTISPECIES: hypothetical protein [Burkholderia]|uniref:hypothetical protein n=1 Tax=Burkholderia TaxID=32008 RepID=UPI0004135A4B|nr:MULTISPECIES: hypothetical protein [Burkholderia]
MQDIAWHRSIGRLIETLDQPGFWLPLIRLIEEYVAVDSRVAPMFGDASPQAFAECPYEDATSTRSSTSIRSRRCPPCS